ncbi:hypothetical protein PF005_g13611 [Phytophthora fragariae]|uniref:Uncharacterized protein n=1 Tax=Phytophthora fragariae TaxID=53985 RepID=A0A6A3YUC5_9STRA|nr:hypothetical protein PF009_g14901 [Phytophthora fragariae]KAE9004390.1 hypothetical protein PF011_g12471 [Phytophthora fragariae]KAE9104769.1 hypothetical protein PF007_g13937 [Phytophthora fragariae]KAE9142187.1 hypothetical protein PF006_g12678 [Phytophthora fragariae]KAE9204928.1 hypothetical protein PF005_g13611 [Phytophthora fragariae]
MTNSIRWDTDGVDGNPPSIDVLLEWLARPGNAQKWRTSAGLMDGSRSELVSEIHDLFLSYGITHRTRHALVAKLWQFDHQLDDVERWLQAQGSQHSEVNKETERAVLQMCPYYHQLAPVLRPSWPLIRPQLCEDEKETSVHYESSDEESWQSFGVQRAAPASPRSKNIRSHPQKVEYAFNSAALIKWDSDAADGRPSSLDVLVEWLVAPGNAERWCAASGKRDGSQVVLASEVYDLLLVHGITYRSHRAITGKLHYLEEHFDKAEDWLRRAEIQRFDDSIEAERTVLQMCPVYPKIAPVLQSARRSVATASSRPSRRASEDMNYRQATQKSVAPGAKWTPRKRALSSPQPAEEVDVKRMVFLKAEPEERREFFKLELQVKRDQAICVRAKARKELFDMGMSPEDVDRLLPL